MTFRDDSKNEMTSEMTSEEKEQKFHTDDVSLIWVVLLIGRAAREI